MKITTPWGEKLNSNQPLPEYPRPQFERESYICLNGLWNYQITKENIEKPNAFDGKIVVPFCPECQLSGVMRRVMPDDFLFYERKFDLPESFIKGRVLLNFGAVDYISRIYVNDIFVGEHIGGYNPFSFDITDQIVIGVNKLTIRVTDPSDTGAQARGKQTLNGSGIWYTPSSGIWQTVWLESVPLTHIQKIRITPDIDNSAVKIKVFTNAQPQKAEIAIYDGEEKIASSPYVVGEDTVFVLNNQKLWSPENPHLYDVVVVCDEDMVHSYFGQRKFSIGKDKKGFKRMFLNNKPYFHNGMLDQGYWCDGLYTAPSDEALIYDIQLAKDMGFNMLRKHIKVEPYRWYYHCDKLGIIVWQDMVNGGGKYKFSTIGAIPFFGKQLDDSNYKRFSREDAAGREEYVKDLTEMLDNLYNTVSIGVWVPFNEGWGQFDSKKMTLLTKQLDSTRVIDSTSGWHDQGGGDFKSIHCYFKPFKMPRKETRAVLLSEFGGYSHQIKGHVFSDKVFGYRIYKDIAKLNDAYKKLFETQIIPAFEKGLAATVYTQLSDVESEINGIVTYDRRIVKFDKKMMNELHSKLKIIE